MGKAYGTCARTGCTEQLSYLTQANSKPLYCARCEKEIRARLKKEDPNMSDDSLFWATHAEITSRPKNSRQEKLVKKDG
jgi:hypothetical protein